jgi:hypothetical protein
VRKVCSIGPRGPIPRGPIEPTDNPYCSRSRVVT